MAGPGLLAHVLTSKYADHLSLCRQSARQGVELERSTLADWVGSTNQLLTPLVDALRHYVMAASKLHADDTPVPVLAPGNGKTKTGRLWTTFAMTVPQAARQHRRSGLRTLPIARENIRSGHLREFRGTLQADAYAGFNQLYANGCIQEVACWAHVRRKFYDLQQAHASLVASEALQRIAALYGIEKEIRGRPPDERREVRNQQARPLLESLRRWFETALLKLSRKSDTTAAIRYALGLWEALMRLDALLR